MKFIVLIRAIFIFISSANLAQLPILLDKIGLSVGEIVATFTFVQCVFLVLSTWLSSLLAHLLHGHRNVALGALGFFVCSQILYFIGINHVNMAVFFLAQSIHAIAFSLFYPLSNTMMEQTFTDGSERKQRGLFQSIISSIEKIGSLAGVSLAASSLDLVPWIFGMGASLLVLVLFCMDNFPKIEVTNGKLSWKNWMEVNSFRAAYPAYFLATVQGMLLVSSSLYLIKNEGNPVVLVIGQWIGTGSMSFFGYLTQKKGNRFGISISLICLMLGLIGLIYTPHFDHFSYLGFLITGILLGISTSGGYICFQNVALEAADKDKQTEGYSCILLLWRIGILTGQLCSAYLGHLESWYTSLGIAALCYFLIYYRRKLS